LSENLIKDEELAQIEHFYKNLPVTEESTEEISVSNQKDEEIHDSVYGIAPKKRSVIIYSLTALFCAVIIIISYLITIFTPGDEIKINDAAKKMRLEKGYTEIKSQHESLVYELGKTRTEAEEKKKKAESVADYENTKSALRTQIEEKKSILASLSSQLSEKEQQIASLDSTISQKNINPISLPPGKYTVGKNILPGKYSISGSGKFMVASKDSTSKVNTVLGATPFETTLEKGDIIKLETTVRFTPIF
jgi:hypothetical protein